VAPVQYGQLGRAYGGEGLIQATCIYVSSSFRPDTAAVATRSAGLVDALQGQFAEVLVLTAGASRLWHGVPVMGLGVPTPNNSLALPLRLAQELGFAAWVALRLLALAPRPLAGRLVVVLSTPPFWLALAAAAAAHLRGALVAVDVRDRYPDVFFAMGLIRPGSTAGRLLLAAEAWLYRHSAMTTTVTQAIADGIAHDHGGQLVSLVRNGFDSALFVPDPHLDPPSRSEPLRVVMHGMFGRFFDSDAFAALLRGIQRRQLPVLLHVVGNGPQMGALEQMRCSQLTLSPPLPQAEVARFIARCHVGLAMGIDNASMRGTFPTKVFEAIGCGLPVLVFPQSEAGLELAARGMGWTFAAHEVSGAIETLAQLTQQPALWQQARERVLDQRLDYIRAEQAERYAQLLASAVCPVPAGTPTAPSPAH